MSWLLDLAIHPSAAQATAHTLLILGLIISLGVMLGSLRVAGISLGVAGALFVGLLFGHFHFSGDPAVLDFAQGLGLVLFVYTIGIQVGPSFVASLRAQGLKLNLLAASIVALGVVCTLIIGRLILPHSEFPAVVGVFCGATTSTPSLAATRQAVMSLISPGSAINAATVNLPVLGYAVAYPFGVIGIILSMFVMRWVFRVNLKRETEQLAEETVSAPSIDTINIEIKNHNLHGMALASVLAMQPHDLVVSRIWREGETHVALDDTVVSHGDVLHVVGHQEALEKFRKIVGDERSDLDLKVVHSDISARQILVSQKKVIGYSVPDLKLSARFGVAATRISRGEVEMTASPAVKLQFGDRVTVVGGEQQLDQVAGVLGDSATQRDRPMVAPMFVGIIIGVLVGSVPLHLPGFPAPVTLGLAGGPLITAIVLSLIGKVGPLVWYMPRSANLMLREIGIVTFLACVGLNAGGEFVNALTSGHGFLWMGYGALITLIPLLIVGAIARLVLKLNYLPLCGLIAGSMTDTAALTFAMQATGSEAPSLSYATVYPMAVLLRVFAVQAMILFFR